MELLTALLISIIIIGIIAIFMVVKFDKSMRIKEFLIKKDEKTIYKK